MRLGTSFWVLWQCLLSFHADFSLQCSGHKPKKEKAQTWWGFSIDKAYVSHQGINMRCPLGDFVPLISSNYCMPWLYINSVSRNLRINRNRYASNGLSLSHKQAEEKVRPAIKIFDFIPLISLVHSSVEISKRAGEKKPKGFLKQGKDGVFVISKGHKLIYDCVREMGMGALA